MAIEQCLVGMHRIGGVSGFPASSLGTLWRHIRHIGGLAHQNVRCILDRSSLLEASGLKPGLAGMQRLQFNRTNFAMYRNSGGNPPDIRFCSTNRIVEEHAP